MTPLPEISVVMSVFNGGPYLQRGLDSILSQEGVELEFIVIDDGSTDCSASILAEASTRDPRLRVIRQENTGLTRALIRGCSLARGRYIARQDGDDVSMPGRLRRQRDYLDSDASVVLASSWAEVIGPLDEPLLVHTRPADATDATKLLLHGRVGPPGHGSVMFRRDVYERVGGYRELLYFAQDGDLWLRMAMQGKLGYVQDVLYRYRISAESISGRLHGVKMPYAKLITALHEARMRGESEDSILSGADLSAHADEDAPSSADATDYFIARCLFGRGDVRALGYLKRALSANPRNLRAWALLAPAAVLGLVGRRKQLT